MPDSTIPKPTTTPSLRKTLSHNFNINPPRTPFDSYSSRDDPTGRSSLDRIKARMGNNNSSLSSARSNPTSTNVYSQPQASRSSSTLVLPKDRRSSTSSLLSRSGSVRSRRSSGGIKPDIWEEEGSEAASIMSGKSSSSGRKSFMDRLKRKPKENTPSPYEDKFMTPPTSHPHSRNSFDYVGKWNARRESVDSLNRPTTDADLPSPPESDNEGFEFIEPDVSESPTDILKRAAAKKTSQATLKDPKIADSLLSSGASQSPLRSSKSASTLGGSSFESVAGAIEEDLTSTGSNDTRTIELSHADPKLAKDENTNEHAIPTGAVRHYRTGHTELLSLISTPPKLDVSHITRIKDDKEKAGMPMQSSKKAPLVAGLSQSELLEVFAQEPVLQDHRLDMMEPAELFAQTPTIVHHRLSTMKPVESLSQEPKYPGYNLSQMAPKETFSQASVASPHPILAIRISPGLSIVPSTPSPPPPRSSALTTNNHSFDPSLLILFITILAPVLKFSIDHIADEVGNLLLQKIYYGFLVGLSLCIALRLFEGALLKVPEQLAYLGGRLVGPIVRAAREGMREGRGEES